MTNEVISKYKIKQACLQIVDEEIDQLEEAIAAVQSSSNDETKSTAGDKHETSKAMAQIEVERLGKQLEQQLLIKEALSKVNTNVTLSDVSLGAVVETTAGRFFIAVGLGKVVVDQTVFFVTSPVSPIGKELQTKAAGDHFLFKGNNESILKIT